VLGEQADAVAADVDVLEGGAVDARRRVVVVDDRAGDVERARMRGWRRRRRRGT
jgi:hypothetical protein